MNKFRVLGAFKLPFENNKTVIYGEIVSGKAKVGMKLLIPDEISLDQNATIIGVEFVDKNVNGELKGYISLILDINDDLIIDQLINMEVVIQG